MGKSMERNVERESEKMSWWVDLGYLPFENGNGDFPRTGQVIRYYREQKRDDGGRAWTQSRLAAFLTVSEKAVWDIENRDASVDVDRRQRISQCLDIPPILLGIRTREEILKVVEHRVKFEWDGSEPCLTPQLLERHGLHGVHEISVFLL